MPDKPDWLEQATDLLKEKISEEAGDYLAGVPALLERHERAIEFMDAIVIHWIATGMRVFPDTDIVSLVARCRDETPEATLERLSALSPPALTDPPEQPGTRIRAGRRRATRPKP